MVRGEQMKEHLENCILAISICPKCGLSFPKKEIDSHDCMKELRKAFLKSSQTI